jgi:hypothetical protein
MMMTLLPPDHRPTTGTPDWWLARLSRKLDDRAAAIKRADDYYCGRQPLAYESEQFREHFAGRFRDFGSNFMALVVETHRDRLKVQGIRYGEEREGDREAWHWWQANRLDAEASKLHTEVLVKGVAYVLVWPNADGVPESTIEDPLQVVVETAPGQGWRRLAALKRFMDPDGWLRAELYLPGRLVKYRSNRNQAEFSLGPSHWASHTDWELTDDRSFPLRDVPIVPFVNRPRDGQPDGESAIARVMSNQDVINILRAHAVVAADFASFKQRWAIGVDVPIDPKTGAPVEPFRAAVDRLWIVRKPTPDENSAYGGQFPEAKFGEFSQTDVSGLLKQIEQEIQAVASISRTPPHYLINMGTVPSGESLKTVETALVAKVKESQLHLGEAWEEVLRLSFAWKGDPRGSVVDAELVWADPESRVESVLTDSITKQVSAGLPFEIALEKLGYSPTEIIRIMAIKAQEDLARALFAPEAPAAGEAA